MTTILDQRSSSLCGWSELIENPLGLVLGERWPLALLASRHLFSGPNWCQHVCSIAFRKHSPAALLCDIRGLLVYPAFRSTVQALQIGTTPIFYWLVPVVVLHFQIRVPGSCAQTLLARSAAVWLRAVLGSLHLTFYRTGPAG
jgi:hypothetical protein